MCDTFETNEQEAYPISPLQNLIALVCMLLRKSNISGKVLSFFLQKTSAAKLSFFVREEEKWYACCILFVSNLVKLV